MRLGKPTAPGPRIAFVKGVWSVDPLVEEVEVVETEVSSAELLSRGIEVEVEGVDGVDLREARVAEAAVDGALDAALLLLVAKAMENVEGRGAA